MRNGWPSPSSVQVGGKFYDVDALSYIIDPGPVVNALRGVIAGAVDTVEYTEMLDFLEGAGKELREELACQL